MKNSIILCTVILVAFAGQAVAAIVIDNFEEGDFSFTATSGSGVQGTQSGSTSNIIGGERYVILSLLSGTSITANLETDSPDIQDDEAVISVPVSSSGLCLFIYKGGDEYEGDGSGLSADLTAGGQDRFVVSLSVAPSLPADWLVMIVVTGVGTPQMATSEEFQYAVPGSGSFEFAFDDFVPKAGATLDFSDVDEITVALDSAYDEIEPHEFRINVIETTPEPATLGLLVIGGLVMLRHKRKKGSS